MRNLPEDSIASANSSIASRRGENLEVWTTFQPPFSREGAVGPPTSHLFALVMLESLRRRQRGLLPGGVYVALVSAVVTARVSSAKKPDSTAVCSVQDAHVQVRQVEESRAAQGGGARSRFLPVPPSSQASLVHWVTSMTACVRGHTTLTRRSHGIHRRRKLPLRAAPRLRRPSWEGEALTCRRVRRRQTSMSLPSVSCQLTRGLLTSPIFPPLPQRSS